jgi:hypothetical protein
MARKTPLDPDTAYMFRKINEMGRSKPAAPKKASTPQIIRERPEPKLIREDVEPQPFSERADPPLLTEPPSAPAPLLSPEPTPAVAPESIPTSPPPELVELVKLYMRLGARDREELLLLARIKHHLSKTE